MLCENSIVCQCTFLLMHDRVVVCDVSVLAAWCRCSVGVVGWRTWGWGLPYGPLPEMLDGLLSGVVCG